MNGRGGRYRRHRHGVVVWSEVVCVQSRYGMAGRMCEGFIMSGTFLHCTSGAKSSHYQSFGFQKKNLLSNAFFTVYDDRYNDRFFI